MTPEGQVITQKEIDAKKREEEREQQEKTSRSDDYDYDHVQTDANENAPKVYEQDSESDEKDDYVDEMQRLIDT